MPYGTESNPPAWDPERGVVVAYDAGNAVVRAWKLVGDERAAEGAAGIEGGRGLPSAVGGRELADIGV